MLVQVQSTASVQILLQAEGFFISSHITCMPWTGNGNQLLRYHRSDKHKDNPDGKGIRLPSGLLLDGQSGKNHRNGFQALTRDMASSKDPRKNNHYPIDFLPQLRYSLSVASKQPYGEIAQLVEQAAHIRSVRGPSPFLATKPYHSW